MRPILLAGAWLIGAAALAHARHIARSPHLPGQPHPDQPDVFVNTIPLERDEINPDLLRTMIGVGVDALVDELEHHGRAADWGTLTVTISPEAYDIGGMARMRVSVRELA